MNRRGLLIGGICWVAMPAAGAEEGALAQVNRLRRQGGRSALRWSPTLAAVAQAHGNDMARRGFFSHQGSDGSDAGLRLRRAGYGWCAVAENIAKGQRSLGEVMGSWEASSGHRRNLLNRRVSELGVARAAEDIWVMVLAHPGC